MIFINPYPDQRMRLEYLFRGDEHREAIEKYQVKNIKKHISDLKNSNSWILQFTASGSDASHIANSLNQIHEDSINTFHPAVLVNDSSAYYTKKLYPLFDKFERNLRRLLYTKMAVSKTSYDPFKGKLLEDLGLNEIFSILFLDEDFSAKAKGTVNKYKGIWIKSNLLEEITNIPEEIFWDVWIGEDVSPEFRKNYETVKYYRNQVMHIHNITTTTYLSAKKMMETINSDIKKEIQNVIIRSRENKQLESEPYFDVAIYDRIKTLTEPALSSYFEKLNHIPYPTSNIVNPIIPYDYLLSPGKFTDLPQITPEDQKKLQTILMNHYRDIEKTQSKGKGSKYSQQDDESKDEDTLE